jgi:hypothetical protein
MEANFLFAFELAGVRQKPKGNVREFERWLLWMRNWLAVRVLTGQ